jgi:RNA polymerase sigma-70 factor (ECF subfamily)
MSAQSAVAAAQQQSVRATSLDSLDDSSLFERLVSRHQERLYRVAFRMTGNADEAQDLLQDAVIEAFRAFKHFRRGTYFDKWLYRIMSRTFIDRKRSEKRVKLVSLDEPMNFGHGDSESASFERDLADPAFEPGIALDRATLDHRIQEGLEKLSAEYRLVMILSDIEEFSYEEVAAALNCPIGTVRSRLHRARTQMREHLNSVGYTRN